MLAGDSPLASGVGRTALRRAIVDGTEQGLVKDSESHV